MPIIVNEIFYSIQGESLKSGFTSLFVRLSGCNLNCKFCDTEYAKSGGKSMSIDSIISEINKFRAADHITITGGEPLLQNESINLIKRLIKNGYNVQIETNGSLTLKNIPYKVRKIVDIKTPSSGEAGSFLKENLNYLRKNDEIKFVISNIKDYEFSKKFVGTYLYDKKIIINFSPTYNVMPYKKLADLIMKDNITVRLNLQLHKIIGLEKDKK